MDNSTFMTEDLIYPQSTFLSKETHAKEQFIIGESTKPQARIAAMLSVEENIMPLSWHMPVSKSPFRYGVAIRKENYSHTLVSQHQEFALNFLNFTYFQSYHDGGSVHGKGIDKFTLCNLTPKEPLLISSKLIEESYMIYECRVKERLSFGDHDIFIADVLTVLHKKDEEYQPTLFLGKGVYETTSGNPFRAQRTDHV